MRIVETILRARLLQKVNILKLGTVFYCHKEPGLKISNYQIAKHDRVTMSERATLYIRSARLTLDFLPFAAYGLSRNPKDQTGNNSY